MAEVNINTNPTENVEAPETQVDGQNVENNDAQTPEVSELLKQIADLKVELNKNKKARDKALSETSEYKKQLRAKMSADEQAEVERKEAEEEQKQYIASLENFKKTAEAQARYALQGMDAEMAKQAAEAEINGDYDALADIQKKYTQQVVKDAEAKWLKTRPQANAGGGNSTVTQEEFNAMGIQERTKLFREQPDVYKALIANSK